jgi:predicted DNA binding protein
MKFLQLSLGPTSLVFHPVDQCLATQDDIYRDALLQLNSRGDGTYLALYQLIGDRDVVEDTLVSHDAVLDCEIVTANSDLSDYSCRRDHNDNNSNNSNDSNRPSSNGDGEGIHAFVRLDVSSSDGRLVDMAHRHALIIDTPIAFDGDAMYVTLLGTDTGLRSILQSMPDDIDFTVSDAGEYDPVSSDLLSPLTDRQLEVFETAVEQGYYDVPRRATHRDLAGTLGCAPSTVDEHLRKAESSVVTDLF